MRLAVAPPPTSRSLEASFAADTAAAMPVFRTIAEGFDCGVLLTIGDRIAVANQAMASMVGLSVEALVDLAPSGFLEHVCGLVDRPPELLGSRRLLPAELGLVCEEFELARPVRSVVRWVTRRLSSTGNVQLATCTDITTEVDLAMAQERFALTDPLTGLMNRRGMDAMLARESARLRRHRTGASVVLCDIDRFKSVNDVHGHAAGDQVLRRVARAIAGAVRASDTCARWGGEEFLILLPETSLANARTCAEHIRLAVERSAPIPVAATLSAGVAEIDGDGRVEPAIQQADERLYAAKANGRNQVG